MGYNIAVAGKGGTGKTSLTGILVKADNTAVAIVTPADGPSLGVAPSGI